MSGALNSARRNGGGPEELGSSPGTKGGGPSMIPEGIAPVGILPVGMRLKGITPEGMPDGRFVGKPVIPGGGPVAPAGIEKPGGGPDMVVNWVRDRFCDYWEEDQEEIQASQGTKTEM